MPLPPEFGGPSREEILRMLMRGELPEFERKLDNVWEQGRGETEPQASFHVILRSHSTQDDANKARDLLGNYDAFIPEGPGWNESDREQVRKLSDGKISPEFMVEQLGFSDGRARNRKMAEFERIYDTKKPIAFVDVPETDPLFSRLQSAERSYRFNNILQGSFEDALLAVRKGVDSFADAQKQREEYIAKHLPDAMKELVARYPELKQQNKLNVLIEFGIGHFVMFRQLKAEGRDVDWELADPQTRMTIREEAARRITFGKELGDDLLGRVVLEKLYYSKMGKFYKDYPDLDNADIRDIANVLSIGDIKNLFEIAKNNDEEFIKELNKLWISKRSTKN